mmetsp:Transcript_13412/g.32295  ORF Transcript_13412/g.32295 Transcript_13412/m.32295 type:complete len:819 (+) Transcript_13412:140-2596(+)|eukprot:CAMPEP_0113640764 /NCGR_PEP_ID=MMETSP0017_2-20120614/21396_1 /TAXON_ID=2856 /ORGANISM="Cylindrotheca closterium" /LENGTH=818 /DNA_ID=CAMNT_0000552065 /DNA_START=130 /DNA_END=2589 /DNA_ORIENTATION=- /assembly_acc=CAM_ASM_000147
MSSVDKPQSTPKAQSNDEMIGSLGEALAGVNLGSAAVSNGGFSFPSQPEAGDPFRATGGDWGSSYNEHDPSNQNTTAATPKATEEKSGLDLFLQQSPSQLLGNDVFKLSTGHLPGLHLNENGNDQQNPFRNQSVGSVPGRVPAYQGRGNGSPSGTNESSRSASPYANADGGRTIQAYHGGEEKSGYNVHGNHQSIQSPYNNNVGGNNNNGFANSPYDSQPKASPAAQQQQPSANPPAQGQVLYMAVPTPDGRGQVLQPVQMVQLPGKPFYQVVPGQGGMPPVQGGMMEGQAPMMMVPQMMVQQGGQNADMNSIGGNNGMNSGNKGYNGGAGDKQYGGDRGNNDLNTLANSHQYAPASNNQSDTTASSLYSTPQRPSLDSLLGQVRRLSRDQVGCRLVQQALDEEGPMAATMILNEGLPFWGEAMVDPFGNYLFQKILEKITPEERVMLVKSVSTRLVNASLNLHGTRSVQKIVELCAIDEEKATPKKKEDEKEDSAADILTRSLAPAAARLCIDSHGNHVIQRILLKLGHTHAKFVFDAVAESVGDVARHRHGCCVIQRCLDSPPGASRSHLVSRIVDKSLELMQDAYGNYVVQYVLDVCSDEDVHAVCESVIGKVNLLAIQKFSSNVMEKCLERCTDRVKEHYMEELSDGERIRELMMDPFGNYVVQRALSVATHAQAVRLVESMRPHLLATAPGTPNGQRNGGVRNTAGGRRIMAKICRRFPNFTLNPAGTGDEIYSQNKGHHRHQHPHQMMAPMYGQQPPHMGQHYQQHYAANPIAMNMGAHQFDQRQPYYEIGTPDPGYYQHAPHMGHGAYQGI